MLCDISGDLPFIRDSYWYFDPTSRDHSRLSATALLAIECQIMSKKRQRSRAWADTKTRPHFGAELRGAPLSRSCDRISCARLASIDLRQRGRDVGAHGSGRLGRPAQSGRLGAGRRRAWHRDDRQGAAFRRSIWPPASPGDLPRHCSAVNVSPLLRELIVHTVQARNRSTRASRRTLV